MADFVALDWEQRELTGLEADVGRGRVRVRRGFRLTWPDGTDFAAEPEQAGAWLRGEFASRGIVARRALVSLPREDVVVRQLEVPDVPDAELPDLVRLQAETKASSSLDQLVLDFLPLPKSAGATVRHVLLVTIARDRLERIRRTLTAAGCELAAVGVSPLGAAALVAHVEARRDADPQATTLIVVRHGERVEISLMRDRRLLFTHSTQLSGDDARRNDRLTLAEVRRSLGSLSRVAAEVPITRGWVIGAVDESGPLCALLSESLACDVGPIDPTNVAGVEFEAVDLLRDRGPFAGPLGMLLSRESAVMETVDFLAPRRAVVAVDRRRQKIGAIVAAAVAVALLAWGVVQQRVRSLDREAADVRTQLDALKTSLDKGRPVTDAARALDEWRRRRFDVPGELDEFAATLPGTDRLYVTDLRFGATGGEPTARLQANGYARARDDVDATSARFAERQDVVHPHEILRDSPDANYPWTFQLDLAIPPDAPAKSATTLPIRRIRIAPDVPPRLLAIPAPLAPVRRGEGSGVRGLATDSTPASSFDPMPMTSPQRTKILTLIAAGCVLLWLGVPTLEAWFVAPLDASRARLDQARGELTLKTQDAARLNAAGRELQAWRGRSLPPNPLDAQRLYQTWLTDLAQLAEIPQVTVTPGRRASKGKVYVAALVAIEGEAKLAQLDRFLRLFQRTDLAHRIASLSIESPAAEGDPTLKFSLTAEGLSIAGTPPRTRLFPRTALSAEFRSGSAATTLDVADPAAFPQQPGFRVRIGNELLEVVAVAGAKWTVRGGADGTKTGSHRAGDAVELLPLRSDVAMRGSDGLGAFLERNPFVKPRPKRVDPPPTGPRPTPPPIARTEDASAAETTLSAVIVADGEPEAWLHRRSNGQRTVVRRGSEVAIGEVRGTVHAIQTDHVVLKRGDDLWRLRLGDSLRNLEKLPNPPTPGP